MWCAFSVLPHKKSAIYVDLSNVSNARLQQADAWRARHEAESDFDVVQSPPMPRARNQATTSSPDGPDNITNAGEEERASARRGEASEPQPPWIAWTPGMSLPRPGSSTWGNLAEVTRLLRRERCLVPVLPPSIILGTASDSPDTVRLNIGVPVTGPDLIPRSLDEKGNEIASYTADGPMVTRMTPRRHGVRAEHTTQDTGQATALTRVLRFLRLHHLLRGRERSAEAGQGLVEEIPNNRTGTSSANAAQNANYGDARSTSSSMGSCDGIIVVSN